MRVVVISLHDGEQYMAIQIINASTVQATQLMHVASLHTGTMADPEEIRRAN